MLCLCKFRAYTTAISQYFGPTFTPTLLLISLLIEYNTQIEYSIIVGRPNTFFNKFLKLIDDLWRVRDTM